MKKQFFTLCLVALPALINAQGLKGCPIFVPVPRDLNDNFLREQRILQNDESEVKKDRELSEALHKMYKGCETQSPYSGLLKQADDALQAAETNRKSAADAFDTSDKQVRKIITDAHGIDAACLYIDQSQGDLGAVVTVKYYLQEGKVLTMTTTDDIKSAAR